MELDFLNCNWSSDLTKKITESTIILAADGKCMSFKYNSLVVYWIIKLEKRGLFPFFSFQ